MHQCLLFNLELDRETISIIYKDIFMLSLLLLLALMHNCVLIYILLSMLCKSKYLALIFL